MPGDSRLDDLFALPPDAFTGARDELAKELRADGDKAAANEVKALRRPTLAAWALNQLARQDRDGLERLREAGEALAREQRRAMSGLDHSGLRAAQQVRRQVTDELLSRALGLLRESGVAPDPHVDALRGAFDAAALDAESGQSLLEGRLSRPPAPPSGFGALSAVAPVAADDAPAEDASAQHTRVAETRSRLEAALAETRGRLEAAQAEARARREDADAATRDAQRAADEVQRLERELSQAREHHGSAEGRALDARQRVDAAEATVARRQEEVVQAESELGAES